jgi:alkanesulfonate monooxygenase SsuD/methylene tetrahydromethanopterin reductase-like flavin-dependent oxidoreductase (luciferase family)
MTQASFGFLLPTRELVMAGSRPDPGPVLALAEHAEALGFSSVWVGDSILARPRLDALTTLAAVAARTREVALGTAVLLPALRHPVVLANEVANLDLLSGGRVLLGVGIAARTPANAAEFAACGISFPKRIGVFEECVEAMRRLWAEPEVTFEGRHVSLRAAALGLRPHQQPGVPVWMTAPVEAAQRRLLRLGDGWVANPASPDVFAGQWAALQTLALAEGRDPQGIHRCVYTTLSIDDDVGRAEARARAFVESYYDTPYDVIAANQGVCFGDARRCATWLADFVEAGAQTVIVRFAGSDQAGQLERCAGEVLPMARAGA